MTSPIAPSESTRPVITVAPPELLRALPTVLREPLRFLTSLAEQGPFVHLPMGGDREFFLIHDPETIQELLLRRVSQFEKFPQVDSRLGLFGEGLLTSEEPRHMRHRRMMQPAFHHERVNAYAATVSECAGQMADEWATKLDQTIDVADEMNRLALEIICRTMFGYSAREQAREVSECLHIVIPMLNRLVMPLGSVQLSLPLPSTRRYFKALGKLDKLVYSLIDQRRRLPEQDRGNDLLAMLLAARDTETGASLTDRELRDEVTTIFVAGHETTANALAWAWYLISTHPEVRARMEQEFDEVLRGTLPEPRHYPELRYTQAVMKESLRLYPAVWILGRKALEDVTLGPMEVRKGAVVLVCMFTLHRRPELYGDALAFRPERWLEGSPAPHRMAYLPFGAGSRLCIGERLAWTESVLILASLAQRFHLKPERAEPPTPMTLLTLRPKEGVKARVSLRGR